MSIPKIIHQTWKSHLVPPALASLANTWRRHHPGWRYRLWTDKDNRRFIQRHYPAFLEQYDQYRWPIQRADAIRYFLLHHYGGLYVDLDFQCLKPFDDLLEGHACVLGLESDEHCLEHHREKIVCNALMASVPGHPLFQSVISQLPAYARRVDSEQPILETTGPFMLTNVYARLPSRETVAVLPAKYFYPLSRDQADEFRRGGTSPLPVDFAWAIHLHLGTWWRAERLEREGIRGVCRPRRRWRRWLNRTLACGAAVRAGWRWT